jgi:hypothetical protein
VPSVVNDKFYWEEKMKFKANILLKIIVVVFLTGCVGPLVPVIDLANIDSQELQASQRMQIYMKGEKPPLGYKEVGSVQAWSCKNKTWEPPASKENAIKQLKLVAYRQDATAIMDIEFGSHGTSLTTNCWSSVLVVGMAIKY